MPRTEEQKAKAREWWKKNRDSLCARRRAWYWANREKILVAKREEYRNASSAYIRRAKEYKKTKEGKEVDRSWRLKKHYGITLIEWRQMYEAQSGACAICRKGLAQDKTTNTDHCHKTGRVRGLLCGTCNKGLGYFKDNTELMHEAIRYLERHKDVGADACRTGAWS